MREGNSFSLSTLAGGGGGTLSRVWMGESTPFQVWTGGVTHPKVQTRGYPIQDQDGGYPIQGMDGGYPIQDQDGGYPIHTLDRGYPIQDQDRGTRDWMGYPHQQNGVPPPIQTWDGEFPGYPPRARLDGDTPPPPSAKRALTTRRVVCLLCSRRRTFLLRIAISTIGVQNLLFALN